ncbi:MAG: 2TM domain-containing protein [Methanomicrobiales archaeon]|nr:2TM domain-containing protein [Methanomicrobiales archaeon]
MEDEAYQRAKSQVEALKGFYSHLGVFIAVNALLFVINYLTSPGFWWFYWVTIFWGFGLLMHGLGVFSHGKIFTKAWEEKKIQEYMGKEK